MIFPPDTEGTLFGIASLHHCNIFTEMPTEELVCIDEMGTAPSSPLRRVQAVVTNDADDNDSPLSSPPAVTSDHAHETIGKSSAPFKPDKAQCWSCFTTLRRDDETGNSVFFYTIHEHPLLNFIVCSVCADNVESVEKDALDIELCDEKIDANSPDENNISACSWCGLDEDDLEDPDPPLADGGSNALFLCDKCPRAFCTRCVVLSHGGGSSALRLARAAAQSEDEEWSCCNCEPTDFLTQLQESCKQIIATTPNSDEESENDSEDACISKLIDELHVAEDGLEEAQQNLEDVSMDRQREKIEAELIEKPDIGLDELEEAVEEELEGYRKKWDDHHNRCSDTITYLQEELESKNVDLSAFYFIREKEKGSDPNSNDTESHPEWKAAADAALDKHDIELGFSKGEFRGASGELLPLCTILLTVI